MFISDFAIRRPVITIVTMLALVVFGIFALFNLDTDEFPDVQPPIVAVAVVYPGASPENVEREILEPMEESISGISGVNKITSSALDGFANLIIEFDYEKNLQEATQQIRDEISAIRNDLPPEMEEPILTRFDPADLPIVSMTLSSPRLTGAELTSLADPGITRQLRALRGIAEVNVVGGIPSEMTVELNPTALQAAGVGIGQVVQAIQSQNLAAPVGRVTGDLDERTYNDEQAVGIDVIKSKGFSTTAVADDVRRQVGEIQARLPEGVSLRIVRDAGVRVEQSVDNVQEALVEGAALTVIVVFLLLNSWR
jgi:HAE1 family hydrophobic/amphiphilic exporter-1